ncbi:LysR family transcriptional regulator [Clostridium beijerinckii]|uniref:HTH-type transcriptional regulator CynR n=1 Tax=Clostridium beijerinckii TaxID=1520 RepID=A0A1S8SAW3_CLOBE|nr:LysR family transcriptional regulator [Clostridium beijerinckii]NRY60273.1 DNA-binding transcriptional LysR family regulator [Clostridium beijerinckii]OOM62557.1 HTH-type transcriptional regulator CynR [Clostridium beijerinckii]
MDLKQLEYMVKIAEEKNITKAAEKLFITQSALNQQLLKLEKELGASLFYRSRTNWHLTEVGEIYISAAKEILGLKKETYNKISDLISLKNTHLSIGLTPERGISMFASVYPGFHRLHPNVIIEPIELSVREQEGKIEKRELDIGFLTLSDYMQKNSNVYHTILKENIIVAIPSSHPLAKYGAKYGDELKDLDLSLLKDDNFVLISKGSTIRDVVNPLFKDAGFSPKLLFETRSCKTLIYMVRKNLCCTILPEHYAIDSDDVVYFSLPQKPQLRVVAMYKKGIYLSKATRDFIDLASSYWTKLNQK